MGATPISAWRLIVPAVTASIGATHQETTAAPAGVHAALLSATGNCHVQIGPAPIATGGDTLVKSTDPPLRVGVSPGEIVSVIQDGAAAGTLYVTWLTH